MRESAVALDRAAFGTLLRSGALDHNGMPPFPEITDEEITGLYMFIRAQAREALGKTQAPASSSTSHM